MTNPFIAHRMLPSIFLLLLPCVISLKSGPKNNNLQPWIQINGTFLN